MPTRYKISGTLSSAARIIIIKESNWSIESNTEESGGAYSVESLTNTKKFIIAKKSDGESLSYGNVTHSTYPASGDTGIFGGGYSGGILNTIEYITISSVGNAAGFGDITHVVYNLSATSNGPNERGIFAGRNITPMTNAIDYVTISSISNASDFGDVSFAAKWWSGTSNLNNNMGIFGAESGRSNIIEYITISSLGNSTDFGDLLAQRSNVASTSNGTDNRGVFAGDQIGQDPWYANVIDYVTISSIGNASDFGDLSNIREGMRGTSNA